MYRINVYVPLKYAQSLKQAMFDAGAGRIGLYEHCCWQTLGYGQFKPGSAAQPYIGESGKLEVVPEYRVEMVCEASALKNVVHALRRAHPYEEPAFDVTETVDGL